MTFMNCPQCGGTCHEGQDMCNKCAAAQPKETWVEVPLISQYAIEIMANQQLTEHDWLQIEMAANGCVSGTSDEWPDLCAAIEKISGHNFGFRKPAAWLQGFCEGVMLQREIAARLEHELKTARQPHVESESDS